MARQEIAMDLVAMQEILTTEEKIFQGHLMNLLSHCADLYNERFKPTKEINGQLIYLRIKKEKLKCNFQPTRSPSSDQIKKMQAGRNKLFSIKAETVEDSDDLEKLLCQVNSLSGSNYILERHGDFCQLTNDENGPCLSNRQMLIYLQGMRSVVKKTHIDTKGASEYNQAQQCA